MTCDTKSITARIAVNHNPDVARKIWNCLINPDQILVSISDKAGQASDTDPGPRRNQMFTDIVQFAGHGAVARNAQQPSLLRHVGVVLIDGDELPPFGRRQMSIIRTDVEAEGHRPNLPRHAARLLRLH